jgi:diguanylate cyclase (GGDEF)-like protein
LADAPLPGERDRRPFYGLEDRHSGLLVGRVAAALAVALLGALSPGGTLAGHAPMLGALGAGAAALQLALWVAPRRRPRRLRLAVDVSLVVDAAWAGACVGVTGGVAGPLVSLFLLTAVGTTLGYSARTGVKAGLLASLAYVALLAHAGSPVWTAGTAQRAVAFWGLVCAAAAGAAAGERELRRRAERLAALGDLGRRLLATSDEDAMLDAAEAAARRVLPGWGVSVRRGGGPSAPRLAREGATGVVTVPVPGEGGAVVGRVECRRARRPLGGPHRLRMSELHAVEALAGALGSALWRAGLMREVERASLTDALTGLANRRALDAELGREVARGRRKGAPVALCLMDVDRFKTFNDRHGHLAGDAALAAVARAAVAAVRGSDLVARYGGEEIAMLLPGADEAEALRVAERVRGAVAAAPIEPERVTASIGVAVAEPTWGAEQLVAAADAALYRAKRGGRDRVVAAAAA